MSGTKAAGFNWYPFQFGWTAIPSTYNSCYVEIDDLLPDPGDQQDNQAIILTPSNVYSINAGSNSCLNMWDGATAAGNYFESAVALGGSSSHGWTINPANGYYIEVRANGGSGHSPTGFQGGCSVWTISQQYYTWNFNASNPDKRATNLDVFEVAPGNANSVNQFMADFNFGTCSTASNYPNYTTNFSDFANFHTFGRLYVPPSQNGGTGLLQCFIDNSPTSWSGTSGNISFSTPGSDTASWYVLGNETHNVQISFAGNNNAGTPAPDRLDQSLATANCRLDHQSVLMRL